MFEVDLNCTPWNESCAQVGQEDYSRLAGIESRVWRDQLIRAATAKFGEKVAQHLQDGTLQLMIRSASHDFGSYKELIGKAKGDKAEEVLFWMEGEGPSKWDEIALKELKEAGYPLED